MSNSYRKEMKDIIDVWEANGYSVIQGGNHLKVYSPRGCMVSSMASTPSDRRALLNIKGIQRRILSEING